MNRFKKILLGIGAAIVLLYVTLCIVLWYNQEKMIFHPHPLPADYTFHYKGNFKEVKVRAFDGKLLSGLLFKADSSKGLVFYLHGNAGALDTWGDIADIYTSLGYDIFMLDYRGFGKSEGTITGEVQLYEDVQAAYDVMKRDYPENNIVVEGYSIGTGPAAMLAGMNRPKLLILQAPYYSLTDVAEHLYPTITPRFLNRYKFPTYLYVQHTHAPVVIFHGDSDETIYYGSSVKLKEHFKYGDTLITLKGAPHGQLNQNEHYQEVLKVILK